MELDGRWLQLRARWAWLRVPQEKAQAIQHFVRLPLLPRQVGLHLAYLVNLRLLFSEPSAICFIIDAFHLEWDFD